MESKNKKIIILSSIIIVLALITLAIYFYFFKSNFNNNEKGGVKKTFSVNESNINKEQYRIIINETYYNYTLSVLNQLNESYIPNWLKNIKSIFKNGEIKKEFKPVILDLYYNYKKIEEDLNKNKTFYCEKYFNKLESTNALIITIFGEINSKYLYKFEGNKTKLILDIKENLKNVSSKDPVILWIKKCKIKN